MESRRVPLSCLVPTALLMVVTIVLLWKVQTIPEPAIVALAAVVGLVVYPSLKG